MCTQHKKNINGLKGYHFRPCMAGKFPPKGHIYVNRHNGVKRDSGGCGWIRMGAGECIGTQRTLNEPSRGTDRAAGRNFGKGVCEGN